jgi:hypothetical protein
MFQNWEIDELDIVFFSNAISDGLLGAIQN